MADVQRPTEVRHGGVARRAAQWCVTAVTAGCVVIAGAPPASAEPALAVSGLVDQSSDLISGLLKAGSAVVSTGRASGAQPYPTLVDHTSAPSAAIAPGKSGYARVGLTNTSKVHVRNDGRMYMELWAPYWTRFTDVTLTPVDGALGAWNCTGDGGVEGKPYETTVLRCSSDTKGRIIPAGKTVQWQANMKVYGDAPAHTVLPNAGEGGYGAVFYYTNKGRGQWSTMSLTVLTSDPA